MTFPFQVPADLAGCTTEELVALTNQVRTYAAELLPEGGSATPEIVAGLTAARDLAVEVRTILSEREQSASAAASLMGDLDDAFAGIGAGDQGAGDAGDQGDAGDAGAGDQDGAGDAGVGAGDQDGAVTAASGRRAPSVRDVAGRRGTGVPDLQSTNRRQMVSMRAAADVPNFATGQRLSTFTEAAEALAQRIDQYPHGRGGTIVKDAEVASVDGGGRYRMTNMARHGAVQFVRDFPPELRVDDSGTDGLKVAEHAANQRRLPGGGLIQSAKLAVQQGRSLTAAAGWCAPSDTIWDLVELETLDGLLDLPELQTTRGGWNIPAAGGPNFATIWGGIGNSGETHLSEANVIGETAKVCYDIPCPTFTDVRLGVDYFCLTGSLLQRRGYPEVVARFGRGAMTALAHKINKGVIAGIVTAAGAATIIPSDPSGDDAASGLLSAIELAAVDAKYRNRLGMSSTLEVVLPWWVLAQIRAGLSRRTGIDYLGVTDAMILDWFAIRGTVPRFVYDWQDGFSGLAGGPGGATPLTALPTTANFVIYPAGAFVKAVQPVVNLDTVYDSTKLATNEYTAVFAEDGWAVLQMAPYAKQYTAYVDPSGVVGCCPIS